MTRATTRFLLILVAGAFLVGDGYVYGLWTGRWHDTQELTTAAARLDRLPQTVGKDGEWQGTSLQLDPAVVEQAEFAGYILRRYENRRTGAAVTLLVACGRRGPLSVHTPEVCYRGAGFRMLEGDTARQALDLGSGSTPAEVWKGTFARERDTGPERLRVVWSWYDKGAWTAPENPRWTFAGQAMLYKLYVTQEYMPRDPAADGKDSLDFLQAFLPKFDRWLAQEP
jgi:EpsI family protein